MHVPIFKKNAKSYLGENPDLNVMRHRTIAEEIAAPQTFCMESIDFRKCGRRNLGARWGRQQQGPQQVLETTAPNNETNARFISAAASFEFHGNPRSAPNQTRQN